MMNLALLLITAFALLVPVTWMLFLAIMTLERARDAHAISVPVKVLGSAILFIGYLCDFLLNLVIGTLLFMEFPREALLSPRVARLQKGEDGYRKTVAAWICANLLDPFDPSGCHCK